MLGKWLRAAGVVLALGSIVCGVWLQFSHLYGGDKYGRMDIVLVTLTPAAAGLILVGVGHALALYEDAKRHSSD